MGFPKGFHVMLPAPDQVPSLFCWMVLSGVRVKPATVSAEPASGVPVGIGLVFEGGVRPQLAAPAEGLVGGETPPLRLTPGARTATGATNSLPYWNAPTVLYTLLAKTTLLRFASALALELARTRMAYCTPRCRIFG